MLLAQVEGFLEIARQGNMRRAARALAISQPALTARLQGLEVELAAALFRRTHSGMVLTPAGRAFLPHADRAVEAIRSGSSLVRALEHGVTGEVALAVAPAVSAYVLPEILVRFVERHPDVRLLVRTGHSEEIVDLVAQRRGRPRDRQASCATRAFAAVRCTRTSSSLSPGRTIRSPSRVGSTSPTSATPSSSCSTGHRAITT